MELVGQENSDHLAGSWQRQELRALAGIQSPRSAVGHQRFIPETESARVTLNVRKFVTLFLAASRRLERTLVRLHPVLTVDQSYVLSEVSTATSHGEPITAQQISERLRIEKSTLSRLLGRLADAHMVTFTPNPNDRRERLLRLTEVGRKFLERDLTTRDLQIEEFAAPLSQTEGTTLAGYLSRMADALGEAPASITPGEHPLKPQIRRLTRALGFLSGSLFGSTLSLEESQMLGLLSEHSEGLARMVFREQLPYDQTRISRLLTKYEEEGLLVRAIHPDDRRQFVISLSPKGQIRFDALLASAQGMFERGLSGFSPDDVATFEHLLTMVTREAQSVDSDTLEAPEGILVLKSEQERRLARDFLLKYLAQTQQLDQCGETLIGHQSRTYVLAEGGALRVLIEAVPARDSWSLIHFAEADSSAPVFDLFVALCRDLFVLRGAARIDITSGALRAKFGSHPSTVTIDANNWEDFAMRLSSRRLDA